MWDLYINKFSLHRSSSEIEYSFLFVVSKKKKEKKRKKKRYKAIHWQIVTRKVTENGLGAINTGRGSERGWCSGVELRTRASCVTDVQQVAFLGSYPLAPSLPSPSLQANPGHIKSFLNVLTLAVWLLFDRYRPHFDVRPTLLPFSSLVALPLLSEPRNYGSSIHEDRCFLRETFFFIYRISVSSVIHFFSLLLFCSSFDSVC